MHSDTIRGLVFNVQGFTVHDGPGIRTEFFMKGCPLSCEWCSNPEGMRTYPEPGIYPDKCLGLDDCTRCVRACRTNSILISGSNRVVGINRDTCAHCMGCAHACPSSAIQPWGEYYTVEKAMEIIRRDKVFYERTGGGGTISGGESLLQPEFVAALLRQCKEEGFHTCVESALHVPRSAVDQVLPYTDLFITDIKTMDPAVHKARCGVTNEKILDNIRYIVRSGKNLVIRTPVLKGFNATDESIRAIGDFIVNELGNRVVQYQLLPYRQMGTEKYKSLNRPYPMEDFEGYEREEWEPDLARFLDLLIDMGINAVTGNNKHMPLGK